MDYIISKFEETMGKINSKDKIMIFHDIDMDGISAAVLLSKYLHKQNVKNISYWYLAKGGRRIEEKLIEKINNENYSYFFIMDIAAEEFKNELKRINAMKIIIDHHIISNDIQDISNILMIKPQLIGYSRDPSTYPTSWLTYNLLTKLDSSFKEYEWLGILGLIGDSALSHWKLDIDNHYKELLEKIEALISFAIGADIHNINEIRKELIYTDKPETLLPMLKKYEYLEEEVKRLIKEGLDNKEETEKYVLCKVKSKQELKSIIANELSKLYPEKTVILVYDKGDEYYYLSLRNQTLKVNLGKILKEICNKYPKNVAQGGGHVPAAGAVIKKEKYEEFIKELKDKIKTH